jgi:hypothetical protein
VVQFSNGFSEALHGWKIPCSGDERAEDSVKGPLAKCGSFIGRPGACASSNPGQLVEGANRASLWRTRGYGSALPEQFLPGRALCPACTDEGTGRSQRCGSVSSGTLGGPPELDVVTPRQRDRATRRPQHLALAAIEGAAQKWGLASGCPGTG